MSKMFSSRRAFSVRRPWLAITGAALCFPLGLTAFRHHTLPPAPPARYLYVLGCGATVDKLDTVTERKVSDVNLASKTDLIPNPEGHLDGCLANGAVYQPSHHVFYTAVPTSAHLDAHSAQQYRLLSFSVPEMKFDNSVALAGFELSDPPELGTNAEQAVIVMAGDKSFGLTGGRQLQPMPAASPDFATELNLSGYRGAYLSPYVVKQSSSESIPAEVVDSSGDIALVQLSDANGADVFAAADRKSKRVIILHDLPRAFPQNVHLSPGGAAVLAEAANAAPNGAELTQKTGQLVLVDAATGKRLKQWTVPNLDGYQFLAITPNGKIAYHLGGKYRFTNGIGATYPNEPVYRHQSVGPPLFFAAE